MRKTRDEGQDICQLQGVIRSSPSVRVPGLSPVVKIKLALKRSLSTSEQRRIKKIINRVLDWRDRLRGKPASPSAVPPAPTARRLEAGDRVRVRSEEDIRATLDHWHSLKGCGFLGEMAQYCGTTQRVLKRVERFIDERDYRAKKAGGIVLLEGAICSGTGSTGRCDRSCFFFWREEWLEPLDEPGIPRD